MYRKIATIKKYFEMNDSSPIYLSNSLIIPIK